MRGVAIILGINAAQANYEVNFNVTTLASHVSVSSGASYIPVKCVPDVHIGFR